jgi:hypothetical protein
MAFVRAGYLLALRQFWPDIYALTLTALVRASPAAWHYTWGHPMHHWTQVRSAAAIITGILLSSFCPGRWAIGCGGYFPIELSVTQSPDFFQPLFTEFLPTINRIAPTPKTRLGADPRLHRERDSMGNWAVAAYVDRDQVESYSEPDLNAQVLSARGAQNAADAFAAGPNLPAAHRAYLAGAVAFKTKAFASALQWFEQAAALPDAPQQQLWARFMAGRSAARLGQSVRAAKHFQAVRHEVEAGANDLLGLAFTSLGEEAAVHFQRLKSMANIRAPNAAQKARMHESARRMVQLYLAQVSQERDSATYLANTPGSGTESLRQVSVWLIDQPAILEASISEVWVQAVLASYLLARSSSGLNPDFPFGKSGLEIMT